MPITYNKETFWLTEEDIIEIIVHTEITSFSENISFTQEGFVDFLNQYEKLKHI